MPLCQNGTHERKGRGDKVQSCTHALRRRLKVMKPKKCYDGRCGDSHNP